MSPRMFVVMQVRHALQQAVAIGALSAYLTAATPIRPDAICFTSKV